MTKPTFFVLLLLSLEAAAQSPRSQIEAAYQRSARAADYKFYPSLVAYRAPDFEVFAPNGARIDLSNESERYSALFQSALKVTLGYTVAQFVQLDPRHCQCQLNQVLSLTRPRPGEKKSVTVELRSKSLDEWELTAAGWRLRRRRITHQAYRDPGQ